MTVIRWQLVAPLADRRAFKADLLAAPYRSGTVILRSGMDRAEGEPVVSCPVSVTAPPHHSTHVLVVIDVYAGGAFLIVTDKQRASLPATARSVTLSGEDELPSTLIISERDVPDVPAREVRALRIGQRFFFQAADR